jgi:hypothetical protein
MEDYGFVKLSKARNAKTGNYVTIWGFSKEAMDGTFSFKNKPKPKKEKLNDLGSRVSKAVKAGSAKIKSKATSRKSA